MAIFTAQTIKSCLLVGNSNVSTPNAERIGMSGKRKRVLNKPTKL
jgi:hypothetical protein